MSNIGAAAFNSRLRSRFFLSDVPDPAAGPITVRIDGVAVPAVTPEGDVRWTYDSTINAIDFEPSAMPEPGSTLEISYTAVCA